MGLLSTDAPEQGDQGQAHVSAEQGVDRDGPAAEEDQEEGPRKFTQKFSFEHNEANSLVFEYENGRKQTMGGRRVLSRGRLSCDM